MERDDFDEISSNVMSNCIFCDIVVSEEPAHCVYEDEQTLAFLDAAPANQGHVLVIPTSHHETLTDMDGELVSNVFQTVQRVASAVESAYDPAGVNIIQSNGAVAGQEVFHAHVHVVPRYEGDEVTLKWEPQAASETVQRKVTTTLQNELSKQDQSY